MAEFEKFGLNLMMNPGRIPKKVEQDKTGVINRLHKSFQILCQRVSAEKNLDPQDFGAFLDKELEGILERYKTSIMALEHEHRD